MRDSDKRWIASCVDDLTLQDDLIKQAPGKPGWYRILSDDERLLRLIKQQADPEAPLEKVLDPIAKLFGTEPVPGPGGMIRVKDNTGASVAIAAPLPGERERPCELITAPLDSQHEKQLESMLSLARALGFTVPTEGATHLHFDASRLQSAGAFAKLVNQFWTRGEELKRQFQTNPRCRRLGPWPEELVEQVNAADFETLSWEQVRARLSKVKLTKYCDFNLLNMVLEREGQNTFEVRILPSYLEAAPILREAGTLLELLENALKGSPPSLR